MDEAISNVSESRNQEVAEPSGPPLPTSAPHLCRIATQSGDSKIAVSPLTPDIGEWWHSNIQPAINDEGLADKDWNWRWICSTVRLFANLNRQRPAALMLGLAQKELHEVLQMPKPPSALFPVALVMIVECYYDFEHFSERTPFLWYLSTFPKSLLERLPEEKQARMLGIAALDVCITHSAQVGSAGRIGLHAAQEGEERLFNWYKKQGMTAVDPKLKFPLPCARKNDGRYFFHNEVTAWKSWIALQAYRGSGSLGSSHTEGMD